MNIDEWIEWSMQKRDVTTDNCELGKHPFHGKPIPGCSGPFEVDVEAVQNQGVIDWTLM